MAHSKTTRRVQMPVLRSTLVAKTITFCFPTGHQTGLPGPNPSGPGHQRNGPSSNATPCSLALAPRVRIPCPNSQGCQQCGHNSVPPSPSATACPAASQMNMQTVPWTYFFVFAFSPCILHLDCPSLSPHGQSQSQGHSHRGKGAALPLHSQQAPPRPHSS